MLSAEKIHDFKEHLNTENGALYTKYGEMFSRTLFAY